MKKSKKKPRTAQRKITLPPTPPPPIKPSGWHAWKLLKLICAIFIGGMGLSASIDQIWGPFWPTTPNIYPASNDPGSPFSLPFSISNKSILFSYTSVVADCLIDKVEINGQTIISNSQIAFRMDDIQAGESSNFRCKIQTPAHLVSAVQLRIRLIYTAAYMGLTLRRPFTTDIFSWVRTTDGGRWIAGSIK
ncbi:MAG: hypothetical protein M0Z28_00270 [Rhodospirillales bacterium]|nr:hypothetical protein [Rhodospirillales bacterium]